MANSLQLDFDRLNIDGISTAAGESEDSKTVSSLGAGDVVSVKYRGKEWRRATIVQVRDEGSFDVTFENGETEKGVPPSMLRMRDSPKHINKASPVRTPPAACRQPAVAEFFVARSACSFPRNNYNRYVVATLPLAAFYMLN